MTERADTYAVTQLGGKDIVARLRADVHLAAGQIARLAFNLDKAVFFDPASEELQPCGWSFSATS